MLFDVLEWTIENPEIGWVFALFYLVYELRGPKGAVRNLHEHIHDTTVVVRALAKVHSDVDSDMVDETLGSEDQEPSDFLSKSRYEKIRSDDINEDSLIKEQD